MYRVLQGEPAILREKVPYVKLHDITNSTHTRSSTVRKIMARVILKNEITKCILN